MSIINDLRHHKHGKHSLNPLQYSGISGFFHRDPTISDELWNIIQITLALTLAPEYIASGDLHMEVNRRMLSQQEDVNPLIFPIGHYLWGWQLGEYIDGEWLIQNKPMTLSSDSKRLLDKIKHTLADYYITDNFQMNADHFPKKTPDRYRKTILYEYDDSIYFYKPIIHDCSPAQISSRKRLDYVVAFHFAILKILFYKNIGKLSELKLDTLDTFDQSRSISYIEDRTILHRINRNGVFLQNHEENHQECFENYPQRLTF